MKNNLIALIIVFCVHILYDWSMPFIPQGFHALGASLWAMTLYGYIAYRVVIDAIDYHDKLIRNLLFVLSSYFIYRVMLNSITFVRGLYPDGSWEFYRKVTSNYPMDVFVWSIILITLGIVTLPAIIKRMKNV